MYEISAEISFLYMQTKSAERKDMNPTMEQAAGTTKTSSAIKAGWICIIAGCLTFWILGLGFAFFGVAKILAIVALCTHQVKKGFILLLASFFAAAACGLIFFLAIAGSVVHSIPKMQPVPTLKR